MVVLYGCVAINTIVCVPFHHATSYTHLHWIIPPHLVSSHTHTQYSITPVQSQQGLFDLAAERYREFKEQVRLSEVQELLQSANMVATTPPSTASRTPPTTMAPRPPTPTVQWGQASMPLRVTAEAATGALSIDLQGPAYQGGPSPTAQTRRMPLVQPTSRGGAVRAAARRGGPAGPPPVSNPNQVAQRRVAAARVVADAQEQQQDDKSQISLPTMRDEIDAW